VLRVLVGEEAALEDVQQAAANGSPLSWIVLKAAEPGEKVVLFFSKGKEFHGHGQVSSKPESTFFGGKAAYRADVDNIEMFTSPIPLDAVAKRFPEWAWVRAYTRGPTTPPAAVADELLDFLLSQDRQEDITLPEEVPSGSTYTEGSVQRILVNRYERDSRARDDCIRHHGTTCNLCRFDFVAEYGEVMAGFIHVHHLKPLSSIGSDYKIDPIQDLRPVCPNCHAVLHRREPPYSLEVVQQFLQHAKRLRRSRR
jgi:HNH endonuclease